MQDPHRSLGFWVQTGLLAGPFMSMIDSSVVNVALPAMTISLHTTFTAVQWVASAYLLALGLGTTATAYIARRWGTQRAYGISLAGFTISSGLCAVSPTLPVLVSLRVVQGLFGAILVPLAMNVLLGSTKARAQMSAAAGMALFLAPAIGPAVGGLLIRWSGWPSVFLMNVPVGLVAFYGARRIPSSLVPPATGSVRFDVVGFGLLAAGMVGISYGGAKAPAMGWLASSVWPYWSAGVASVVGYGLWAPRVRQPIVDLVLFRRRPAVISFLIMALVSIVTFAMVFLTPAFMQEVQGRTAATAGLTLLPQGLLTGFGTWIGMLLPRRWGLRRTAAVGMALLTAGTVGLLLITATSSPFLIAAILCGRGLAIGLVVQPLLTGLITGLPSAQVADANTLFNVGERISGTLGIALIVTLFQEREHTRIRAALTRAGIRPPTLAGQAARVARVLPPTVRHQVAAAATQGFHDVVWWVVGLSALGLLLTGGVAHDPATDGVDTGP